MASAGKTRSCSDCSCQVEGAPCRQPSLSWFPCLETLLKANRRSLGGSLHAILFYTGSYHLGIQPCWQASLGVPRHHAVPGRLLPGDQAREPHIDRAVRHAGLFRNCSKPRYEVALRNKIRSQITESSYVNTYMEYVHTHVPTFIPPLSRSCLQ